MGLNTWGRYFRVSTFGESHGPAIGVIIDGCPAGFILDLQAIQHQLNRRRPGQSALTTTRNEADTLQVLSGLLNGTTTGQPMAFMLNNADAIPSQYQSIKGAYRPSHADYTYEAKYGIRHDAGGGRASARETANWVIAGAVAQQLLASLGVKISAFVSQVGSIVLNKKTEELDLNLIDSNAIRCPDATTAQQMADYLMDVKAAGDTCGGCITAIATGVPAGWGEPVFEKLHAQLAAAMCTINAVHGFEYGSGFSGASMLGSQHNDVFTTNSNQKVITQTNYSGGIQGGISNGMPIYCKVAFKPVASINQLQQTVNNKSETVSIKVEGRHDPCVVPRAVPVVEAMFALVLINAHLANNQAKWPNLKSI
ncbi:MAG: chorismate synthase [Bacteroidia bacterium]|nr:chorismate synthase [Bacteroidia bacterium]